MGAQNFKFALIFPQNGGFNSVPSFQRKSFSVSRKFRGEGNWSFPCPPATMPLAVKRIEQKDVSSLPGFSSRGLS